MIGVHELHSSNWLFQINLRQKCIRYWSSKRVHVINIILIVTQSNMHYCKSKKVNCDKITKIPLFISSHLLKFSSLFFPQLFNYFLFILFQSNLGFSWFLFLFDLSLFKFVQFILGVTKDVFKSIHFLLKYYVYSRLLAFNFTALQRK